MLQTQLARFSYLAIYLVLYSLIVGISLLGDYLLKLPRKTTIIQYVIALADTSIHGFIGATSWAQLVVHQLANTTTTTPLSAYFQYAILRDVFLTAFLSSAIDLDHVIAARSVSIKSLTSLAKRGPFHNTSLLVFISLIFLFFGYFFFLDDQSMSPYTRFGYLLLVATLTHHIRDALRRGFNLWPLLPRPTSPVPLYIYFLVLLVLPFVISTLANLRSPSFGYSLHVNDSAFRYTALKTEAPLEAESIV